MTVDPAPLPDDPGDDYRTSPHPPGGCGLAVLALLAVLGVVVLAVWITTAD